MPHPEVKDRNELAIHFRELGFKTGAEIGVLEGFYSRHLCRTIPDLKLFCIDSWGMGERRRKEYHLRKYEEAKIRLSPFNTTLIHKFSMDAVKDFEDNSLDFVYIDANHQPQFVTEDIREWTKKVRPGGIVAGHDYDHQIEEVVNKYVLENHYDLQSTIVEAEHLSWWFVKTPYYRVN